VEGIEEDFPDFRLIVRRRLDVAGTDGSVFEFVRTARPVSVKARRTASTLLPRMRRRLSLIHALESTSGAAEPWKCGIT